MAPTKTVLTTGANSGIGLATAIAVAKAGYASIGTVRSEAKAETVAKAAADAGVTVETVVLDVTDAAGCAGLLAGRRLYGLVNNAGYGLTAAVEDTSEDEVRQIIDTMLIAPMRLARLALPGMRDAGEGRIVNISSVFGRATTPLTGWYQGVKHGLEAVSDALRMEVASAGIKVVLVEPGGVKTNIWEDLEANVEAHPGSRFEPAYQRTAQSMRLAAPLMVTPDTVAKAVVSALGRRPRTRYVVGLDAVSMTAFERIAPTPLKDLAKRLSLGL